MVEPDRTIDLFGEAGTLRGLLEDTIESFRDDRITAIDSYAFMGYKNLKYIFLPNLKRAGIISINNCENLLVAAIGYRGNSVISRASGSIVSGNHTRTVFAVPDDLVDAYKSAVLWDNDRERICGFNEIDSMMWHGTHDIPETEEELLSDIENNDTSKYHIGGCIQILLKDGTTMPIQIIGKRIRRLSNGVEYAQLEWASLDVLPSQYDHRMNPPLETDDEGYKSGTGAIGGIVESEMFTYLNTTILDLFPDRWRSVIKDAEIGSTIYNVDATLYRQYLSHTKLRILSVQELGSTSRSDVKGVLYPVGIPMSIKPSRSYWLRTPTSKNTFNVMTPSSGMSSSSAETSYAIRLSFST